MEKQIKEVLVTPEYARELLAFNTNNRKLNDRIVERYAKMMRDGQWMLSNDAITISEGNVLLNGQHRLNAVIKAGVSVPFIVLCGVPFGTYNIMDTPKTRNVADILTVDGGSTNANTLSSAIHTYVILHYDKLHGTKYFLSPTNTNMSYIGVSRIDLLDIYKNDKDIWDSLIANSITFYSKGVGIISKGDMTAITYHLLKDRHHSIEKVNEFWRIFVCGDNTTNTTITLIRNFLLREKLKTSTSKLKREVVRNYYTFAWNCFITNRTYKHLNTSSDLYKSGKFI